MKKLVITFVVMINALCTFAQSGGANPGIKFETGSWTEILAKAKRENKYIFLDAYTTWCGPCKWMDANVFPTAEAGDFFNRNFINARLDMEKGEGIEVARQHGVNVYPTYLFLDGNGEMVHRIIGRMETAAFITSSADALDPAKQLGTIIRKFENGERSPEFLSGALLAVQQAADSKNGAAIATAYLETQTDLLARKNMSLIVQYTTSTFDRYYDFIKSNAAAFQSFMGKDSYDQKMYTIVYLSGFKHTGFKRSTAKKAEISQFIQGADEYYKKMMPEKAPKLLNEFALYVYEFFNDWDGYAQQAMGYYDQTIGSSSADELNSIAWKFFTNINNPRYITRAVAWAEQSVKVAPDYANTDTLANLYNKLGDKKKAKECATRAIALGKANGQDVSSTVQLLKDLS